MTHDEDTLAKELQNTAFTPPNTIPKPTMAPTIQSAARDDNNPAKSRESFPWKTDATRMPFCMVLVTWVPIRNAPENSSTAANPESSVRYASAFILFVPWKTTDCIASGTVSAANAITTEIDIAIRGDIWNALAISDSSDSPFCSSSDSVASACPLEPLSALAKEDIVARGRPRCEFSRKSTLVWLLMGIRTLILPMAG
uniref:Uncharacterized protein n=1 Tax=Oryza rufipogon TaxID=4529 RepID=A0A0E0NH70_ORYRU